MQKNMGSFDKTVRVLFALIISALYFINTLSGTLAIILGSVAIVLIATSFVGFCPLYAALRISTGGVRPTVKEGVAR